MIKQQPTLKDKILSVLHAQYSHAEAYCDAQTTLGNTLIQRGNSVAIASNNDHNRLKDTIITDDYDPLQEYKAVVHVRKSLNDVQQDWLAIQQLLKELNENNNNTNLHSLIVQHEALAKRVFQTVHERYHRNGIPLPSQWDPKDDPKTVALATLRASIARIQEALN